MKKSSSQYIFIVIIVALLVAITLLVFYRSKHVSWYTSYQPDDSDPYGTQILYRVITESRPNQKFYLMKDSLHFELPQDPTDENDTYLFIGSQFYGDSADVHHILQFVEEGNSAYFLSDSPNNIIFDSLVRAPIEEIEPITEVYDYEEEEAQESYSDFQSKKFYVTEDTTIHSYLHHGELSKSACDITFKFDFKTKLHPWSYFKDGLITYGGDTIETLGSFDENYNNYIRFKYGKGKIYFHSTPLLFTNYFMLDSRVMNYCRDALSPIGTGNVYWDEDNRKFDFDGLPKDSYDNSPQKPSEGPLEFILSESGLRNAWYVLLATVVLYLLFGLKRKQRIIRTAENMENTSIEYAEVLSQMFMKQKDHKKLVLMKMELFRAFIKDRYGIRLPLKSDDLDISMLEELSQKSSIPLENIKAIFDMHFSHLYISKVETSDMLGFHQKIESFYTSCK